jgi:hypothetical protein
VEATGPLARAELVAHGEKRLKLRRLLCLCVGLTSAACGDAEQALPDFPGRTMDGAVEPTAGHDAGASGGEGGAGVPQPGSRDRRARMVSAPGSYALVGEEYSYTPRTNTKARSLEMVDAPAGMAVRSGMVRWTPTEAQAGNSRFTVRALGAGSAVSEQQLDISVAKSTLAAEGDVDTTGGALYVQGNAERRMLGVGMVVPARAVGAGTRLSVSELSVAPGAPNSATPVRAMRFGPTGQIFDTPARVMLPLPENVTYSRSRLGVYVYDPAGHWQRVPMVALDLANGLVGAKAEHFSVYAAIQSSLELETTLTRVESGACEGSLAGHAAVTSPLDEIALESVNNLSSELTALLASEASVQDLLGLPSFTGSLRAVQVLELVEGSEGHEVVRDQQLLVTTLFVPGDGSATITHADALGNVHATKTYPSAALELADIAARLRGAATTALFAGEGGAPVGLNARLHLSYFEGDASQEPVSLEDLGIATAERGATFDAPGTGSAMDADCDGLLDAFDGSDDSIVTTIEASPAGVASIFVGDKLTLSARVLRGAAGVLGSWSLLDTDGAKLDAAADARVFSASSAGRYLVSYRAEGTSPRLEHIFAIDVAERVAEVLPPSCKPTRALDIGRVGEAVVLSAVLGRSDSPRSALKVEWGLVDHTGPAPTLTPAATILPRGDKALFSPLEGGNFTVGCRVFDGAGYGSLGQVDVSVVPRAQNRAPVDLVLTPGVMNIMVGDELKLHASALDPDGDALEFVWDVDGSVLSEPSSDSDESYLTITAARAGKVKVTVQVSDGVAPPIEATATVLVGSEPVSTVDVDMDGWSPGTGPLADCDDNNASVHPTANDLCGDRVDADCDGSTDLDDCDYDEYTIAQGDCDDSNPNRHPGATELCDGLDNDCNQAVDESWSIGKPCTTGTGQCTNRGVLECSADGLTQLCAASPLLPTAEMCDGVDNDCDGQYDEELVCGQPDAGTLDAGVPLDAGAMDGSTCKPAPEVCTDGVDNDCDGATDGQDKDCQTAVVTADNCGNVQPIEVGVPFRGSFDGAKVDVASSCSGELDLVYVFKLESGARLSLTGATLSAWSIQTGSCDPSGTKLDENYCSNDFSGKGPSAMFEAGEYFLVVKGGKGTFTLTLNIATLT